MSVYIILSIGWCHYWYLKSLTSTAMRPPIGILGFQFIGSNVSATNSLESPARNSFSPALTILSAPTSSVPKSVQNYGLETAPSCIDNVSFTITPSLIRNHAATLHSCNGRLPCYHLRRC